MNITKQSVPELFALFATNTAELKMMDDMYTLADILFEYLEWKFTNCTNAFSQVPSEICFENLSHLDDHRMLLQEMF